MSRRGCGPRRATGIPEGEPVLGRKSDAPGVPGKLQLQGDLEELADCARALNPSDASADGTRRLSGLRMGHLERDPHIFQNVVFRLVAAAVAIDDEAGRTFVEGATECVDTRDGQWNGLERARGLPLARM